MLADLASWPTFIAALAVFGFAPGLVLRVIVLAFHSDDPRRHELLAELYAVPRVERPFWVVEQLEVAICEGLRDRLVWAATGRIVDRWHIASGVEAHRADPTTFWIPDDDEKRMIKPGTRVRLIFRMKDGWGERMWVDVVAIRRRHLVGALWNHPYGIPRLESGDSIRFTLDDVIDIVPVDFVGVDPE